MFYNSANGQGFPPPNRRSSQKVPVRYSKIYGKGSQESEGNFYRMPILAQTVSPHYANYYSRSNSSHSKLARINHEL